MHSPQTCTKQVFFRLIALFVFAVMLIAWPAAQPASAAEPQHRTPPTDQIIIKFKPKTADFRADAQSLDGMMESLSAAAGENLQYVRAMSGEADVLRLTHRMPLDEVWVISQKLMSLPNVEYAEPDSILQHTAIPSDPDYSYQWHYYETYGIDAPAAWDITTGSSSVTVAVIDTGITTHPEFSGRTWPGFDFIHDPLVANDGNGRDPNAADPGDWISFSESTWGYFQYCTISSSSWHGTHTAGTIAANANNMEGGVGINWNAKILPVRVLGKCGGYTSDIADGMRWAAGLAVFGAPANAHPAKVLNLSLGGYSPWGCAETLKSAVDAILARKATIVVSAGNEAELANTYSPANCPGVITVGASTRSGMLSSFSNFGPLLKISAPGGDYGDGVYSTSNNGIESPTSPSYTTMMGTSMAAPHVSGVISLMYSIYPSLTPAQVVTILQKTAKPFASYAYNCATPRTCGAGILDADNALKYVRFMSWAGSLTVTADRSVVAVARPHVGAEIASYTGRSGGSHTAYLPMLFKDAFGGSYNSAFYVQSTDPVYGAALTIKFYDDMGSLTCEMTSSTEPHAAVGLWLPDLECLPEGWVGGAVITSTTDITAVGRPHVGAEVMTYNGFASGSLTSYLPMLFKKAFGGSYNAAFYVQNVDPDPAHTASITIHYYDSEGNLTCSVDDSLAPLASKGYWLPDVTCLPEGWVGGVVVTSDYNIVTLARPHVGSQVTSYSGFDSGYASMYVPMLFKNAFDGTYKAAFYVQNVNDTQTANITIDYYDSEGNLTCSVDDTIAPLASKGYWAPGLSCLPPGWVGGAVVSSDTNIVAVGRPHIGAQVTTYSGVSSGGTDLNVPMMFRDAFGGSYDSALYVQNTDTTNPANVTIRFYDTAGNLICTVNDPIPAKATLGYWLPSVTCE